MSWYNKKIDSTSDEVLDWYFIFQMMVQCVYGVTIIQ